MYAKTGREKTPVQMEKMMHTHHVMQREQSNGLIGFRSFALMSLVRADLHASVNPDKSTMKIVMAAMSSRSMYAFIRCYLLKFYNILLSWQYICLGNNANMIDINFSSSLY